MEFASDIVLLCCALLLVLPESLPPYQYHFWIRGSPLNPLLKHWANEVNEVRKQYTTIGKLGTQFWPTPWPENILCSISQMQAPPYFAKVIKPTTAGSNNLTVCRSYCNGPQDCGSSDPMESCSCAIPSPANFKTFGLDIVTPVPACL